MYATKQAIKLTHDLHGENDTSFITLYYNLANLYAQNNEIDKALDFMIKSSEIINHHANRGKEKLNFYPTDQQNFFIRAASMIYSSYWELWNRKNATPSQKK